MGVAREVTAFLKLDDAEWNLTIDRAEAKAEELSRKSPNIKIKVDAGDALAKLEAVRAATLKVQSAEQKLTELRDKGTASASRISAAEAALANARSSLITAVSRYDKAEQDLGNVLDENKSKMFAYKNEASGLRSHLDEIIMVLGPALIPMLAVAAGWFGTLAIGAGVLGLAFLGIKQDFTDGTLAGTKFGTMLGSMRDEFQSLEKIAATNFISGFSTSFHNLSGQFPTLNKDVGTLGVLFGQIGGHVGNGVVQLILRLMPLFTTFAGVLEKGAVKFDQWATSSNSINKFISYASQNLPGVDDFFVQLVTAIGHLFIALSGLGSSGILGGVTQLLRLFNDIPVGLLKDVAPAIYSIALAWRLLKTEAIATSPVIMGLYDSLGKFGTLATVAVGVGLITSALGELSNASSKDEGIGKNLSAQFKDVTGSAASSRLALVQWALAGQSSFSSLQGVTLGVAKDVEKLGISSGNLITGIVGDDKAYQHLITTIQQKGGLDKAELKVLSDLHQAFGSQTTGINALTTAQQSLVDKLGLTVDQAKQYASMVGETDTMSLSWAKAVQTVATAENSATQTGSAFLQSLSQFSQSAGSAADRAALIGATLKASNGDLLSYGGALASVTAAHHNLIQTFKDETSQMHQGIKVYNDTEKAAINLKNGTIDYNKTGAAPLIENLQSIQTAAMNAAEATYQHNLATQGATKAADAAYSVYQSATRGQLIDEASKLGLTKDQATKLADAYFGIPKNVKTLIEQEGADPVLTVLKSIQSILAAIAKSWGIRVTADTSAAASALENLQGLLGAIHDKNVTITTNYQNLYNKITAGGGGAGNLGGAATGGLIGGIGTGTSDSNIIRVSRGEFIMPADSTARFMPQLEAMRSMSAASVSSTGGFAGGGAIGGSEQSVYYIHIDVHGNVTSERRLVSVVQQGIREDLRRRGKSATAKML